MQKIFASLFILINLCVFGQSEMYDICPIKVSEEVPSVELTNTSGKKIDLKKQIGEQPTIVVFYRGGWCP